MLVCSTEKFATNERLPVTVKLYVASVDTIVPFSVQFANVYPVFAVATNVAVEPPLYVPAPVIVPPSTGFTVAVIVYVSASLIVILPLTVETSKPLP